MLFLSTNYTCLAILVGGRGYVSVSRLVKSDILFERADHMGGISIV